MTTREELLKAIVVMLGKGEDPLHMIELYGAICEEEGYRRYQNFEKEQENG